MSLLKFPILFHLSLHLLLYQWHTLKIFWYLINQVSCSLIFKTLLNYPWTYSQFEDFIISLSYFIKKSYYDFEWICIENLWINLRRKWHFYNYEPLYPEAWNVSPLIQAIYTRVNSYSFIHINLVYFFSNISLDIL